MKIRIGPELHSRLLKALAAAGDNEIGGVLMGEQLATGDFRIVDLTVAAQAGTETHFERSASEHGEALEAFFSETGGDFARFNYLGEWHSHPNCAPIPSGEDVMSMRELLDEDQDIPFSVLLICRAIDNSLALSATLFQRETPHEPVQISAENSICQYEGAKADGEDDDPL